MADNELRRRMNLPVQTDPTPTPTPDGDGGGPGSGAGDDAAGAGQSSAAGGQQQQQQQQQAPAEPQDDEVSDEVLLRRLQKINPSITSLEDIQHHEPAEDEATKRKKKQNQMVAWALRTEKIDREKYDSYIQDSAKEPRQIVYEEYARKRKANGASPEQIQREFKRKYHEDLEPADPNDATEVSEVALVLTETKEDMEKEKNRILRRRYPEMQTLERSFDEHLSATQRERDNREAAKAFVDTYRGDLNSITDTYKKITYSIGDEQTGENEDIDFDFTPEAVNQVRQEFLSNNAMLSFSANYSKETLEAAIKVRLLELTDAQRIAHTAREYNNKRKKKEKFGRNHLNADETVGGAGSNDFIDAEARSRVGM